MTKSAAGLKLREFFENRLHGAEPDDRISIINRYLEEKVMGTGIRICGLNGTGKSALGKALAETLHFYFIDHEDLYFPETGLDYRYASPRTREEAEKQLFNEIKAHEDFIFASVKGDYGEAVEENMDLIVEQIEQDKSGSAESCLGWRM